ncbi:Phosphate ABC transporter, periplasmic phosphate-binding protein PstS [Marinobacterium lacunae]|uniref:Phosphate ABC transporter, periplasmic phosphate-binding protein PstS n=1 Tax=Marinobacterium lacunae TaxID=1232683 RepID=A0A081G0W5_9GAMM|nr:phosphate ABC transporter substrate-binding/OmpA family protein [Marinobacterium lacunae]KEA64420.1 Phosphate ABC transporter, periplasmic phosphate-binding protein PstS [Marinobacterium lacunae]
MNRTLFDLLWQLKRELERQGGARIELPRFIDDADYRRSVLDEVNPDSLSEALRHILPELKQAGALDISRQILSPGAETEGDKPSVDGNNQRTGWGRTLLMVLAPIVLVLAVAVGFVELTSEQFSSEIASGVVSPPQPALMAGELQSALDPAPAVVQSAPLTLLRLHGSNTIGESLAPELLKAFWQQQGAQDMRIEQLPEEVERDLVFRLPGSESLQRIELKAHGSSTGFRALQDQIADLAMASRRIKEKERKALEPQYGDLVSVRTEHVIGMDGLAIIVHPENPINALNTAELARLFSAEVSNWRELGGADEPVKLYSRDENSGTWDSFESMVLKKHDRALSQTAVRLESSTELSERVSQERGAIGFIGLPYALRAKALAVSDEEGAMPVYPTSFTVSTEDYPLTRRLYIYEPMTLALSSPAHKFVEFVASEEGQEVVRKSGFISQNIHRIQPVLSNQLPQDYLDLVRDSSRLSLNFRFNSGTFELDNKAKRDMERVIRFFEKNPGERIALIGFSDSVGDNEKNRQLSLKRAEVVRDQLLARGINVVEVHGLGDLAPVASNATAAGRERNRRVEIWVRSEHDVAVADAP